MPAGKEEEESTELRRANKEGFHEILRAFYRLVWIRRPCKFSTNSEFIRPFIAKSKRFDAFGAGEWLVRRRIYIQTRTGARARSRRVAICEAGGRALQPHDHHFGGIYEGRDGLAFFQA